MAAINYKQIQFDLDGTLLNSEADIISATNHTLVSLGLVSLDDALIKKHVGSGVRQLIKGALDDAGFDNEKSYGQAIEIFTDYYTENCLVKTQWFDGALEVLEFCRKNFHVALFTNKPWVFTEPILEGLDAFSYFDEIVTGGDHHPKKPDPKGAHFLFHQSRINSAEALYVGDSEIDFKLAQNAGMDMAMCLYGFDNKDALSQLNPKYFLNQITDLIKVLSE